VQAAHSQSVTTNAAAMYFAFGALPLVDPVMRPSRVYFSLGFKKGVMQLSFRANQVTYQDYPQYLTCRASVLGLHATPADGNEHAPFE